MRNIGIPILVLLWLLIGWKMCEQQDTCCADDETTSVVEKAPEVVATTAVASGISAILDKCPDTPICFARNSDEPRFGTGFASLRDSLITQVANGQRLRIIGTYGPTEKYEGEFANLGLARAEAVKAEIAKIFDPNRIETSAQLTVGQGAFTDGISTDRVRFDVIGEEAKAISNSTLIYFPFNSTNKLDDSDVEAYLDSVAERVSGSSERVRLTGHTDNIGNDAANMQLGRRRAIVIRDYLVSKGLSANKIIIDSKGESQPVATNATDAGRAQNRRTELEIIN